LYAFVIMRNGIVSFFLFFSVSVTYAQPDTIEFGQWNEVSPYIFGKTNWSTTKPWEYREYVNPNYDTIFWKKDSSLYSGYLKMHNTEIHYKDTSHIGQSTYRVVNGIPTFINSYTYTYKDADGAPCKPWEINQGYATDSSVIRRKFYYNGQIERESEYFTDKKIRILKVYDLSGTLLLVTSRKNGVNDGESYSKLSKCCGLTIIYKEGQIQSFDAPSLFYFNRFGNNTTADKFVLLLNNDPAYSWGHLVITDQPSIKKYLLLYLVKNYEGLHQSIPGRGLKARRKKQLLHKAMKLKSRITTRELRQ
jgi:hypothetical protein